MPLHVSSTCAHHQEVKIALHSLWYHHTYKWLSYAQVERGLVGLLCCISGSCICSNNSYNKTQLDALFLKFIFDNELYMFQTDLPSIIRSINTVYAAIGICHASRPPLWSSGQSFWLQIQRSRVRSPALPDFLSSSGSETGSTQTREVNWGATWMKKVAAPGLENRD